MTIDATVLRLAPRLTFGQGISKLGFGTGGLLRTHGARGRQEILAAALANGITHFDTAPIYGFGEAERALGRFLRGQRNRVTLATKFGLRPSRLATLLNPFQQLGRRAVQAFPALRRAAVRKSGALYGAPAFSVTAVRDSLDCSLRALRTDHVDFFLAHQASAESLPTAEVIGLLEDLRRAGKILEFGVATEFAWLGPVLSQRPELSRIVQFDSELTSGNVGRVGGGTCGLLVTYGFINRTIAVCRERMRSAAGPDQDLRQADDDTLGGLLLRAAVLANPHGLTLMQSRSTRRIERNVRAASDSHDDEKVQRLLALLEQPH